jgi:hypothetical protein
MPDEPDNLVLELLRGIRADVTEIRAEVTDMRSVLGTHGSRLSQLETSLKTFAHHVASDFLVLQAKMEAENQRTRDQLVGLRRMVADYHSSYWGMAF